MRRSLRLACIVAALALATGAAAMVDALGADESSATKVTAQERARRIRLDEARMQADIAREAFLAAELGYKEGTSAHSDVTKAQLDIARAERALAEIEAEMEALERRRITAEVQGASLEQAFAAIFGDSGESFTLHPDIAKLDYAVTLDLKDVNLESAVKMVCRLYNLEYETDNEGLWVIMPGSGFATVAGARVPIIGTVTTTRNPGWEETEPVRRLGVPAERPSFRGDARLVDLDVRDAPLSEVASRLSLRAEPLPADRPPPSSWPETYCDLEVTVDDSAKDVEVTAKIAKWPLGDVLDMLLAQTGLVCTVDPLTSRSARGGPSAPSLDSRVDPTTGAVAWDPPPTIRIHLVPVPELRVAGAGLPFETVVSPRVAIGRRAERPADAMMPLLALRECPKCHATAILPDWKFCPECGAKLPGVKQPAEEGAKGD